MNENKIAFIICYNNDLCMQECTRYIERLRVPEGMETDIIGIKGAESMCAGYNAAMQDSDAKYKVYLHQDTFIINVNFIENIIETFRENPEYGMLGLAGTDKSVLDGNFYISWDIGALRWGGITTETVYNMDAGELREVVAIDGFIMITQADVTWREDIFDDFHMYDVSQSMEFHKAGYKVGVVHQETPWCIHDTGASPMAGYDEQREKFCEEYADMGYVFKPNEDNMQRVQEDAVLKENAWRMENLIESGNIEDAVRLAVDWSRKCHLNNRIASYYIICTILLAEKSSGTDYFAKAAAGLHIPTLMRQLALHKYFLRRTELGFPLESDEFFQTLAPNLPSAIPALRTLAPCVTLNPHQTLACLADKL